MLVIVIALAVNNDFCLPLSFLPISWAAFSEVIRQGGRIRSLMSGPSKRPGLSVSEICAKRRVSVSAPHSLQWKPRASANGAAASPWSHPRFARPAQGVAGFLRLPAAICHDGHRIIDQRVDLFCRDGTLMRQVQ